MNKQNKDSHCKLLWRVNNIMVSFKTVRGCCMHLYKDKAVVLYVSYLWLYFSLSPQLVRMSARVQLIAFLSIKKEFNIFFLSMQKWRKIFILSIWSYKNEQHDWQKVFKESWFSVHQRGRAITESEHRGSDLGTLERHSPFDSTLQCLYRNVETLLNRLLFLWKNTLHEWGWQYRDSIAVLSSIFCKYFCIRKIKWDSFNVPLSPNIYGAIQLIFYSITYRRPNPSEVVSGIYYLWQHPWYTVAISSVQE